jgi:spore germination protein KC
MNKNKRKLALLLLFCLFCFLLNGCFSYKDINLLAFTTSYMIDINEQGGIVIYVETFRPFSGFSKQTGREQRLLYTMEGRTIQEAIRNSALSRGNWRNFTQTKAIIFTEKAAKKGLTKYLDFLDRDQNFLLRPYVFIVESEDSKDIITRKYLQEEYLGILLSDLATAVKNTSETIAEFTMNDLFKMRLSNKKVYIIPKIKEQVLFEKEVSFEGAYVIKNDVLYSELSKMDCFAYNILNNTFNRGVFFVPHPQAKGKLVSLDLTNVKTKSKINLNGGKIILTKDVRINMDFVEAQSQIKFNESNLDLIAMAAEKQIKEMCLALFNQYKAQGIDIFNVASDFKNAYPKVKLDNPIEKTELNMNLKIDLNNTQDMLDFR